MARTIPTPAFREYATVAAVTREDLVNWHQQYVYPNNIILGISGDFDAKAMEAGSGEAFELMAEGIGGETAGD